MNIDQSETVDCSLDDHTYLHSTVTRICRLTVGGTPLLATHS